MNNVRLDEAKQVCQDHMYVYTTAEWVTIQ